MAGRYLCSELEAAQRGFGSPGSARRRLVLHETVTAFEQADPPDRYHRLAAENLDRRHGKVAMSASTLRVEVLPSDWGEVTHSLTRTYGACLSALNMAKPYVPGGAYVEDDVAQEKNMFRRTDCYFRIGQGDYDATTERYFPELTRLLSAPDGVVFLDADRP